MKAPLVSIITPCYNGEKHLKLFFDSIIKQSYRPLELIFVDDGSTDSTSEIVESYKSKMIDSHITFKPFYQDNIGQAGAVNNGLKQVKGDYLIWPDSDDFLYPQSVEKRVRFLEQHKEFGFVMSDGHVYDSSDLLQVKGLVKMMEKYKEYIYEELINGNAVSSLAYMIRTSAFDKINPDREICISEQGQNIQMLLPISFHFKCGYIKEPLYGRVRWKDSHYHTVIKGGIEALINRNLQVDDIFIWALKQAGEIAAPYLPIIEYRKIKKAYILSKQLDDKEKRMIYRKNFISVMRLLANQWLKGLFTWVRYR